MDGARIVHSPERGSISLDYQVPQSFGLQTDDWSSVFQIGLLEHVGIECYTLLLVLVSSPLCIPSTIFDNMIQELVIKPSGKLMPMIIR
jgi:hypothetical protein